MAYWFWREKEIREIKWFFFSMPILVGSLIVVTVLCKSVNGLFALLCGFCFYTYFKRFRSNLPIFLLLLLIPVYIGFRSTNSVSVDTVKSIAGIVVAEDRVESLGVRLTQENLFSQKTWERPLLGWGGYFRGWPIDPDTGEYLIAMIDSTWLITFNTYGLVGLVSLIMAMLQGPWRALRIDGHQLNDGATMVPNLLSLITVLFMVDALLNGMVNPVYIFSSGAVTSWYITTKAEISKRLIGERQSDCFSRRSSGQRLKKTRNSKFAPNNDEPKPNVC